MALVVKGKLVFGAFARQSGQSTLTDVVLSFDDSSCVLSYHVAGKQKEAMAYDVCGIALSENANSSLNASFVVDNRKYDLLFSHPEVRSMFMSVCKSCSDGGQALLAPEEPTQEILRTKLVAPNTNKSSNATLVVQRGAMGAFYSSKSFDSGIPEVVIHSKGALFSTTNFCRLSLTTLLSAWEIGEGNNTIQQNFGSILKLLADKQSVEEYKQSATIFDESASKGDLATVEEETSPTNARATRPKSLTTTTKEALIVLPDGHIIVQSIDVTLSAHKAVDIICESLGLHPSARGQYRLSALGAAPGSEMTEEGSIVKQGAMVWGQPMVELRICYVWQREFTQTEGSGNCMFGGWLLRTFVRSGRVRIRKEDLASLAALSLRGLGVTLLADADLVVQYAASKVLIPHRLDFAEFRQEVLAQFQHDADVAVSAPLAWQCLNRKCAQNPLFGHHFFDVAVQGLDDSNSKVFFIAAVSRSGISLLTSETMDVRMRFSFRMIRRTAVMDDALLLDLGDWRTPSVVVLISSQPKEMHFLLSIYLTWNINLVKDGSLDEQQVPDELKAGWLEKRGQLKKSMKRRYFVLTKESLTYFKDDSSFEEKGSLAISSIRDIVESPSGASPLGFELVCETRTLFLQAQDVHGKKTWMDQIRQAINAWEAATTKARSSVVASAATSI